MILQTSPRPRHLRSDHPPGQYHSCCSPNRQSRRARSLRQRAARPSSLRTRAKPRAPRCTRSDFSPAWIGWSPRQGVPSRTPRRTDAQTLAHVYRGISDTPKSGRDRKIPMTARPFGAMKAHRHLRSDRIFCHADGSAFTQSAFEAALRYACKRAGLRPIGTHVLRHTFCSHLAMRGAAPKAIQELRGTRPSR